MKELLDIVNEHDEVVGKVSYEEVYKQLLAHRIVHILIFNSQGKLALQLRSKRKDFAPHHWATSVGGHVQAGETYEQAAIREFEEELGTSTELEFAFKDWYRDENGHDKFITTFKTVYDGPFMINEDEVEKIEYFSLPEIQKKLKNREKFHPELRYLLQKHFNV